MNPNIRQLLTLVTIGGIMQGTIAQAANPDHVQRLLKTNQCPRCDLSSAELKDANLYGANLVNANLKNADLSGANLGSVNLTDADLTGAKLIDAYLHAAILDGTNLSQADLSNSYLREANFSHTTQLRGAILQQVNLSRSNLSGVNLQGVDLRGANLSRAMLTGMIPGAFSRSIGFLGSSAFGEAYFRQSLCDAGKNNNAPPPSEELERYGIALAKLQGANLQAADLSEALLVAGDLQAANLSQANLTGACMGYAKLNNAVLDGANLQNARLEKAVLEGASLKDVKNADLKDTFTSQAAMNAAPLQSQARQWVGSMNRSQQAHFLEKNVFAKTLDQLYLGIKPETDSYLYRIFVQGKGDRVVNAGIAKQDGLKSYIGFVRLSKRAGTNETTTMATLCESQQPTKMLPPRDALQRLSDNAPCPPGYSPL